MRLADPSARPEIDALADGLHQLALAATAGAARLRAGGDPADVVDQIGAVLEPAYLATVEACRSYGRAGGSPAPATALPAVTGAELPGLFVLWRHRDLTGQSGTGVVLFGLSFPGGPVVTRWRGVTTGIYQLGVWNSVDEVVAVHGHHGATDVVWLFNPPA
ncbi:hypothetical protein [Actinocatenispora rupis]|uniref:Uncharacterized protein n=1 Tax=Actinocatenispora rupis TaxID=519421 RepID=A0A8J3NCN9_9ACTN|nr:hypothetical protein [Actinocatenispora rupis]GID12095.1 hypothetical protein Aru02nite_29840 [Actinocatenispora rupis]